jgi:hypothetical protein
MKNFLLLKEVTMKLFKLTFFLGLLLFCLSGKGDAITISCPEPTAVTFDGGPPQWQARIDNWSGAGFQIESETPPFAEGFIHDVPSIEGPKKQLTCRYQVHTTPHGQKHYRIFSTYENCRLNADKSATCGE